MKPPIETHPVDGCLVVWLTAHSRGASTSLSTKQFSWQHHGHQPAPGKSCLQKVPLSKLGRKRQATKAIKNLSSINTPMHGSHTNPHKSLYFPRLTRTCWFAGLSGKRTTTGLQAKKSSVLNRGDHGGLVQSAFKHLGHFKIGVPQKSRVTDICWIQRPDLMFIISSCLFVAGAFF